jgi:hypothetical protein
MDRIFADWQRFCEGLPPTGCLRLVILDSWGRSRAAGVDPQPPCFQPCRVGDDDLQRRLQADADRWSASPALLIAELVRAGLVVHKRPRAAFDVVQRSLPPMRPVRR